MDITQLENNIKKNQNKILQLKMLATKAKESNDKIDSLKFINELIPLKAKNKKLLSIWNVMDKNEKKKNILEILKAVKSITEIVNTEIETIEIDNVQDLIDDIMDFEERDLNLLDYDSSAEEIYNKL